MTTTTSRMSFPTSISPTRSSRPTSHNSGFRAGLRSSIERMFVLGIDPGLTRCGYGLVEGSFEGVETFRAVRAGTIETDPKMPVEQRLRQLHVELDQLLKETTPNAVAVERVF